MSFEIEFERGLSEMASRQKSTVVIPLLVTAIDEVKMVLDGMDSEGVDYFDVRIQATQGEQSGNIAIPAEGSYVLISNIGKDENVYFVVATSALLKSIVKIGDTVIEIDSGGVIIAKGEVELKAVLEELVDAIKLLTVSTAQGPSGPPLNAAQFDLIKTRINMVLK